MFTLIGIRKSGDEPVTRFVLNCITCELPQYHTFVETVVKNADNPRMRTETDFYKCDCCKTVRVYGKR